MQVGAGKAVERTADGRTTKVVAGSRAPTRAARPEGPRLVLYEFINMLVRIAFQRANPTFGNFGDKKAVKHLPGCLKT